jgi:Xaa-Pro dipeptidase
MSERPIVVAFPLDQRPVAVVPALEAGRAGEMAGEMLDFITYSDDEGYAAGFTRLNQTLSLAGQRCAVEHLHMRVLELRALERVAPSAEFVSADEHLAALRIRKDQTELDAMQRAIAITERALQELIARPLIGATERQIAARLEREMMSAGADGTAFIIVVSGPNSADPHAEPSDRVLQAGDLLTIDCGAIKDGYMADITRTFVADSPSKDVSAIYAVVQRANAAGKAAVVPGAQAQEIDRAARQVIKDAGYGEYFFHRTGHGLGLEVHEPPYIVEGNDQMLESGMVFTVEPGIYIPGLGGVRIEDNIVVTPQGRTCLTSFSRELLAVS